MALLKALDWPRSENVIRPTQWMESGQLSLSSGPEQLIASGGGGPHDPDMETRVSALESEMKDVTATLTRMDVSLARIEVTLGSLATKADIAFVTGAISTLAEKVSAQGARLANVETAINETVKSAVGKALGPWQLPMVLGASGVVIAGLVALLNWMAHQPWFGH